MSEWLLIITVECFVQGNFVTTVTMHNFPSRELCESAGRQATKLVNKAKGYTTVEYKCLRQSHGDWVEGEMK